MDLSHTAGKIQIVWSGQPGVLKRSLDKGKLSQPSLIEAVSQSSYTALDGRLLGGIVQHLQKDPELRSCLRGFEKDSSSLHFGSRLLASSEASAF